MSIVLPMWNEALGAGRAVRECVRVGDGLIRSGEIAAIEVIAVDDGSSDATGSVVEAVGDERVHVLHHDRNRGIGAAIRTGIGASRGDLVAYTDADLPVDMDELGHAIDLHAKTRATVVAAYRANGRGDGLKRRVYSAAWNQLVRAALGLSVVDVNFAFKLFDGPVVRSLPLVSTSVCIDAEILARINRRGGRIEQFGTTYSTRQSGESTLSSLASVTATVADLAAVRRSLRHDEGS